MMKRLPLLFLYFLLTAGIASGNSYFSIGNNDTIWVNPNRMVYGKTTRVHAQFDGRLDSWSIVFTYPSGMAVNAMLEGPDMRIPYLNSTGDSTILAVSLNTNSPFFTTVSASIMQLGYWYNNDNVLASYGTVKWEPGYHARMFDIQFLFTSGFSGGNITIDYEMHSSPDGRGPVLSPLWDFKTIAVVMGNMRGDVNGDDSLTVTDLTDLISYLLDPESAGWDEYQVAAADVNCDGNVTIVDVTALSSLIMSQG